MKIKKGLRWKSIEGLSKGKEFVVVEVTQYGITYRSIETDALYTTPRKDFEKYIMRVSKYWNETNKSYKHKKSKLKEQE